MFAVTLDQNLYMKTTLTKAEEQVMQILWEKKEGFVKDLLQHFPDPKPAYNTVSTIIRILEKKGFVDHRSFGKSHQYYPVVSREQYRNERFSSLMKDYFNNCLHGFTNNLMYCADLMKLNKSFLFVSQFIRSKLELWCESYNNKCHILP